MNQRELKLVAEAKQKEFDRLKDLVLNQMSLMEVGLNPCSQGRDPYSKSKEIWAPTPNEIIKLNDALWDLRENILTSEERISLNE